ncbi:hypothetical protein VNO77_22898 [Canavalia gladiata]|uniref:Uncharacterized protein n=1 Tax=Canavalia gladiata TaxID=3824 RepID=A0AAN9L8Q0_CANGL
MVATATTTTNVEEGGDQAYRILDSGQEYLQTSSEQSAAQAVREGLRLLLFGENSPEKGKRSKEGGWIFGEFAWLCEEKRLLVIFSASLGCSWTLWIHQQVRKVSHSETPTPRFEGQDGRNRQARSIHPSGVGVTIHLGIEKGSIWLRSMSNTTFETGARITVPYNWYRPLLFQSRILLSAALTKHYHELGAMDADLPHDFIASLGAK